MNETTIEIKDLKKVYKIYQSPGQRLKEIFLRKIYHEEFVALNNIDFSVLQGETVGIIGENGAGKSTLLKILAKTLKQTSGSLSIEGKTSALLELGTGFDPELTGEENIYLNAYLMGLSKDEIDTKKEDIINFSELGDFIKRPVKTYSTGMHVRLAFSIATSVDPDILIIDEALSVGDEHFQKKCIDQMMNFKKAGKTILFCSHDLYNVQQLCNRTVWLHKGQINSIGDTGNVISDYQNYERGITRDLNEECSDALVKNSRDSVQKPIRIVEVKIMDKDGEEKEVLESLEQVLLSFSIRCTKSNLKGHVGFLIIRNDEIWAFGTGTHLEGMQPIHFKEEQEFQIRLKPLTLLSGKYSLLIAVSDESGLHIYDEQRLKTFTIKNDRKELGMFYMEHEWVF